MAQANVKLTVDASQATRALQGVQNRTTQLNGGLNRLKTAIAGVGLTVLARQAVNTSANFAKLNVRLGLLTKASGTFARSQEIAANAQKAFGLSATEALEGITDITARLQPLGVGVEDIKTTFFGFNTAAKLAGASTIEASNAFRQLAQALGSGRLQGDEFRSIAEQVPTLLAPIAKELNTTVGGLKKFASEGKLTSDVVIRALKEVERDGANSLKALLENDPTQVFKDLSNASEDLSRAVGDLLLPALVPVVKGLTELTKAASDFINSPIGQASLIFAGIVAAAKGLPLLLTGISVGLTKVAAAGGLAAIALNAIPFVALATGATLLTAQIIKTNEAKKKFNDLLNQGTEQEVTQALRDQAKVIGELLKKENSAKGRDKKIIQDKLKVAELDAKMLEGRLQTIKSDEIIEKAQNNIVKIEKEVLKVTRLTKEEREKHKKIVEDEVNRMKDEEERKKQAFGKFIKRQTQSGELLKAAINGNERQVQLQHDINNAVEIHGEHNRQQITNLLTANSLLKDQTNAIEENVEGAGDLADKFDEIGQAIETSIKNNLTDAITGAQSFGDAMIGVLNKIRDRIIANQLDKLLDNFGSNFSSGARGGERTGLGGFIGGFLGGLFKKNGGPVQAGRPYIVGERQPELFVPRTSGTILPSVPSGGGGTTNMITVNVDASGSSVQGNGSEADQLGGLIASVVQATIIDEQRAGGLLNR